MTPGLSIFDAAREAPDRPALILPDDVLSFAELAERAGSITRRLEERSLLGTRPVAIAGGTDLSALERLHALMAAGTPVVPVHPRLTAPERSRAIEAVGARAADTVDAPVMDDPEPGDPRGTATPGITDDATLAIVFTSGTAGQARGVVLSRRAFVASARASAANLGWEEDDRWLLPLPIAHVGGLSIVTRCLLARRPVVVPEGIEPRTLIDAMERHRVTIVSLVPTLLARILDADTGPPPKGLRAVLLGGGAAPPSLLDRAADRRWPVLTSYGLTEACSQVTTQRYGTTNRGERGSGTPLPGIDVRVDTKGEILVRGPVLFDGYVASAADAGTDPILDSPFLDGGWFPTGDYGRLDGRGRLHVRGRRADRIVTGGENVDPIEVERALEGLAVVRAACVYGVPDDEWGEVVCASVVVDPVAAAGVEPVDAAIVRGIASLGDELAAFKRPRRVAVVDTLPTNAIGKLDRTAAAARDARSLRPV